MHAVHSATQADWTREAVPFGRWSPARRLIKAIRSHQYWKTRGVWGRPMRAWCAARARFWNVVCGSDIPLGASLGGGLLLPHPNGVVMHPDVHIGVNCLVFQQVTLGTGGPKPGVPTIGGHVDIGAGAKVLGGVLIGNHARIGANAVVLCDVPEGATAVGIPARIIPAATAGVSAVVVDKASLLAMPKAVSAALGDHGVGTTTSTTMPVKGGQGEGTEALRH
jgi:serine O-acetyltransferase